MKKRQSKDPLAKLSHPKRSDKRKFTIASEAFSERVPNDWLEAVVILIALVALSGGAYTLYQLSQMMG